MVPREKMCESARKLRDTYAHTPGAPLFRREFGYYCMARWREQGMPEDIPLEELFDYDPPGHHVLSGLGWCEAAFAPAFEEEVIEDRGEHELARDHAGRHVLFFKGRRSGFMPEYVDHPVKDMRTWEEDVKWRLNPASPERCADLDERMNKARAEAARGLIITQSVIGAYMYLRSLIGPEGVLYAFYDMPELIRDCMRTWLELAEAVIARHQQHVTIDELFFGEDICYNHGILISPDLMREFILPYYRQLIANLKARQIDRTRHLYVQVDTDGYAVPVIPIYQELGMDVMSPFEVASGCDVVEIGRGHPELVMFGGIDKRVLATTKARIDRMVERILPAMRERGGYIPTCDHGVPEEVSYENYLHYRKRCVELGG
ncbi:MAG: uroporphyrinogen decarboxylase family protein [Candidatus Brocadiia bacterium]|jgi:uroporphyrinogen decarboxylase|nr:uroporphyrinogen decarboxylase family protein [Candidatus Brocadiia bacterium]